MRPRVVFGVPPGVELIPDGAKTFLWPLCDCVGRDWTSGLVDSSGTFASVDGAGARVFSHL
jgi:hypothetical protein